MINKYMKGFSTSVINRGMQIKSNTHLTPVERLLPKKMINAGECVQKRGPLYNVGGNVNYKKG